MDLALIAQHAVNGLMMGLIYALVAVGFTLFFGVLDVIKFSHGDVLTCGVFTAFGAFLASPAVVASIVSLSAGALLANIVSITIMIVETTLQRR